MNIPFPLGIGPSNNSRALRPSFPISPHAHPHSTIAWQRSWRPDRIAAIRNTSSSRSFVAKCASHACNSVCAAASLDPTTTSGLTVKLREDVDDEEPKVTSREERWLFDTLINRETLAEVQPYVKRTYTKELSDRISLSRIMVATSSSSS